MCELSENALSGMVDTYQQHHALCVASRAE